MSDITREQIDALIAHGEEEGCLNLSELDEFVQEHELEDNEVRGLYEQLEERAIEVNDDCGRESVEPGRTKQAGKS